MVLCARPSVWAPPHSSRLNCNRAGYHPTMICAKGGSHVIIAVGIFRFLHPLALALPLEEDIDVPTITRPIDGVLFDLLRGQRLRILVLNVKRRETVQNSTS